MAGGIIEYLAEGAWTKRLHPGWAAQSGLRAARLARAGFLGPRTVFEGAHGLFHGFAHTTAGDYDALTGDFGARWLTPTLAFNPYPNNFTGHIRALLADGRVVEERQPHMRGGAHEPLTRGDIEEKFALNARHGGWDAARTQPALALMRTLFDGKIDLSSLRG